MPGAAIDARGLARKFAEVNALAGINLEVVSGEAVAVFGPNGAGKTTLLRLLATLLRPSAGSLSLFGQPLDDGGAAARRRIGFLSHASFLYPDLTPVENLEFYARTFAVTDASERVQEVLDDVGLRGWRTRPVRTLSRGLEQRCALARVLLHRPDLLLLDEPFNGLDADAAAMLSEALRREHARGATILMTSHDLSRALDACERGLILSRGQMRWDGRLAGLSLDELQRTYNAAAHAS